MDLNRTSVADPAPHIIALSVVNMIFSAAGTIGNVVVCVVIIANRDLLIVTNYFIFSLAIADLLVCTIAQPMYVAYILGFEDGKFIAIRRVFTFVSVLSSVSNLWAVTVDRFLAISSPLKYTQRLSIRRVNILLVLIWGTAITLGIMAGLVRIARMIAQFLSMIMTSCIVPLYIRIFLVARRHAKLITHQMTYFNRMQFAAIQIRKERENIAAKTVGTVLLIFALCWLPIEIVPFVYQSDPEIGKDAFVWVNTLALCSSALNPLVYSLKMESFRRKVRKVLQINLLNDAANEKRTWRQPSITAKNEETNV